MRNAEHQGLSPAAPAAAPPLSGAGERPATGPGGAAPGTLRSAPYTPAEEHRDNSPAARNAKKRPCFQCGAMTPVKVLDKTGDLCWRCYRPTGHSLVRILLLVTSLIVLTAGAVIGWRYLSFDDPTPVAAPTPTTGEPKTYNSEQRMAILKRYLYEQVPASTLCHDYEIQPADFQHWLEQLFDAAQTTLNRPAQPEGNGLEKRIAEIEKKMSVLSKVQAEIREAVQQLHKESGRYEAGNSAQYIIDSTVPPPREK